ncbi:hypothetical protein L596_030679 [Steinernema carpocapsae]|uniref:Uncharacterized protein n=1 Tax=Steinernema carpocapsae TaxID=34508 RepID=A0A4V5ZX24_STECR|nr:hypothetical protein L596_030679 [Steinernema carpocapsae]
MISDHGLSEMNGEEKSSRQEPELGAGSASACVSNESFLFGPSSTNVSQTVLRTSDADGQGKARHSNRLKRLSWSLYGFKTPSDQQKTLRRFQV